MIPDIYGLLMSHDYPEDSLVASSSVLHEVNHPKTVPPPGHPQGGGTVSIELVFVGLCFFGWLLLVEVC